MSVAWQTDSGDHQREHRRDHRRQRRDAGDDRGRGVHASAAARSISTHRFAALSRRRSPPRRHDQQRRPHHFQRRQHHRRGHGISNDAATAPRSPSRRASTVNIDDADFDPSGNNTATNIITINNGGVLDIDSARAPTKAHRQRDQSQRRRARRDPQSNTWSITGNVNVGAANSSRRSTAKRSHSPAPPSPSARTRFSTSTRPASGARRATSSSTPAAWRGSRRQHGDVHQRRHLHRRRNPAHWRRCHVQTATTINMPSGTVDLDGGDAVGQRDRLQREPHDQRRRRWRNFGNAGRRHAELRSFASLTVNLTDPNAEWTIAPERPW